MSTPTIPAGNLFMNATTYTGTGATQTITNGAAGASFQPDFVWIKNRTSANSNQLVDSVRGVTKYIFSDTTGVEETRTDQVTVLTTSGFSLSALVVNTAVNNTGNNYVGWQWKAGGTAVTNTSGTISSQVSANTTSGFSIVTFTGNATSGATVGHGLGAVPSMVIVKSRSAANNWCVYHISMGNQYATLLNSTASSYSNSNYWNNTSPTSTVFSLGNGSDTNQSSATFVAYCWAPIAGYSAFGSYTGNGSADGPFIYLGFRPKYILIRCTNAAGGWKIYNTSGLNYNPINTSLEAQDAGAEATSSGFNMDWLSNGFKIRTTYTDFNASGNTYIYACFAENPFKYSNAR